MYLTNNSTGPYSLCMKGRIYTDQKCFICQSSLRHDLKKRGFFCPNHKEVKATKLFKVRFGRKITRRFNSYSAAERFLNGIRYENDKGSFDFRDYQASNPLSFTLLSNKWLEIKRKDVRKGSFKNLNNYIRKAQEYFGDRNIKNIQFGELQDFLYSLPLSDKSKSNCRSCLHTFWIWLLKRREITREYFPEFPEINFELGWRKTVDKETQQEIIAEIKNISFQINPKIWIGIKFLATYISIRPHELVNIREKHIDLKSGFLFIPHPKEKKPKIVPLIDEDIEILKTIPQGLPDLFFFRHVSGIKGVKAGRQFGTRYFYKWWVKACQNLGVAGVDLYGGTRHSSTIALREFATPEQIKQGTMHTTNKAFERYYRIEKTDLKNLYSLTSGSNSNDQPLTNISRKRKPAK